MYSWILLHNGCDVRAAKVNLQANERACRRSVTIAWLSAFLEGSAPKAVSV
ncbi:hypothetical protein RRSWK_06684 [Rhodopirellula sp. SWK7]|nr:hypothetical protein RRSWK_06684 [Rhodopirellula sp. SWK7]